MNARKRRSTAHTRAPFAGYALQALLRRNSQQHRRRGNRCQRGDHVGRCADARGTSQTGKIIKRFRAKHTVQNDQVVVLPVSRRRGFDVRVRKTLKRLPNQAPFFECAFARCLTKKEAPPSPARVTLRTWCVHVYTAPACAPSIPASPPPPPLRPPVFRWHRARESRARPASLLHPTPSTRPAARMTAPRTTKSAQCWGRGRSRR